MVVQTSDSLGANFPFIISLLLIWDFINEQNCVVFLSGEKMRSCSADDGKLIVFGFFIM